MQPSLVAFRVGVARVWLGFRRFWKTCPRMGNHLPNSKTASVRSIALHHRLLRDLQRLASKLSTNECFWIWQGWESHHCSRPLCRVTANLDPGIWVCFNLFQLVSTIVKHIHLNEGHSWHSWHSDRHSTSSYGSSAWRKLTQQATRLVVSSHTRWPASFLRRVYATLERFVHFCAWQNWKHQQTAAVYTYLYSIHEQNCARKVLTSCLSCLT